MRASSSQPVAKAPRPKGGRRLRRGKASAQASRVKNGAMHAVPIKDGVWRRRFGELLAGFTEQLGREPTEPERALIRTAASAAVASEKLQARQASGEDVDHRAIARLSGRMERTLKRLGLLDRPSADAAASKLRVSLPPEVARLFLDEDLRAIAEGRLGDLPDGLLAVLIREAQRQHRPESLADGQALLNHHDELAVRDPQAAIVFQQSWSQAQRAAVQEAFRARYPRPSPEQLYSDEALAAWRDAQREQARIAAETYDAEFTRAARERALSQPPPPTDEELAAQHQRAVVEDQKIVAANIIFGRFPT